MKIPTHKITKAEVIPWEGEWGVSVEFDDHKREAGRSGSRLQAEMDAKDRVGEELPIGVKAIPRPCRPPRRKPLT